MRKKCRSCWVRGTDERVAMCGRRRTTAAESMPLADDVVNRLKSLRRPCFARGRPCEVESQCEHSADVVGRATSAQSFLWRAISSRSPSSDFSMPVVNQLDQNACVRDRWNRSFSCEAVVTMIESALEGFVRNGEPLLRRALIGAVGIDGAAGPTRRSPRRSE